MAIDRAPAGSTEELVGEVLARLWQTKRRSVDLLVYWHQQASDYEVKAALALQTADERRNLRMLDDEINQRDGRRSATAVDQVLNKPFAIVRAQSSDIARVGAFHLGIKGATALRYSRLVPLVDPRLGTLLDQLKSDDDRHLRWADIRISRAAATQDLSHLEEVVQRIEAAMEALWSKPMRRLTLARISAWHKSA